MYCFALKSAWTLSEQASECTCVVDGVHHGDQHVPQLRVCICIPALFFSKTPRCFYLLPLECELKKAASSTAHDCSADQ